MTKKWLILITILMLAGVLVSGCADNAEDSNAEEEMEDTTPAEPDVEPIVGEGKDYGVIMEYYGMMKPSEIELNRGESIAWSKGKPEGTYTLVSDDGLFEDQVMDHNHAFSYTFTESGTYTFSVTDYTEMTLTVTVR